MDARQGPGVRVGADGVGGGIGSEQGCNITP